MLDTISTRYSLNLSQLLSSRSVYKDISNISNTICHRAQWKEACCQETTLKQEPIHMRKCEIFVPRGLWFTRQKEVMFPVIFSLTSKSCDSKTFLPGKLNQTARSHPARFSNVFHPVLGRQIHPELLLFAVCWGTQHQQHWLPKYLTNPRLALPIFKGSIHQVQTFNLD